MPDAIPATLDNLFSTAPHRCESAPFRGPFRTGVHARWDSVALLGFPLVDASTGEEANTEGPLTTTASLRSSSALLHRSVRIRGIRGIAGLWYVGLAFEEESTGRHAGDFVLLRQDTATDRDLHLHVYVRGRLVDVDLGPLVEGAIHDLIISWRTNGMDVAVLSAGQPLLVRSFSAHETPRMAMHVVANVYPGASVELAGVDLGPELQDELPWNNERTCAWDPSTPNPVHLFGLYAPGYPNTWMVDVAEPASGRRPEARIGRTGRVAHGLGPD